MPVILKEPTPIFRTPDGEPGRRIEWVGEASPYEEPFVDFGMATGMFTMEQRSLIRRTALGAFQRTKRSKRKLGRADLGLSRDIMWGPGPKNWIRVLSYRDADKLMSCPNAHEFRDLDAEDEDAPKVLYPPMEIRVVGEEVLKAGGSVEYGQSIIRNLGSR